MFNSRPLSGAAGDIWRYLTGHTEGIEEYYLGPGESSGEVFGKGAERLGLSSIDRTTFANLAHGLAPDGSHKLIQTQNGKHTAGIDVTASAEKSVSVAMIGATGVQREIIQACWDEAFDAALEYLQDHGRLCRVPVRSPAKAGERTVSKGPRKGETCLTKGSDTERVPGELVAVKVRHSTSRPTDEQIARGTPPDVHLHSHAFLLNMAWVPDEHHKDGGKWRAIDDHNIKKLRQALEHATQGEFARLLEERLGAKIEADVADALRRRGQVPVELTNVHRQVEAADREMLAAQRAGDAADALANLAERGRFHISETSEQADGAVLAAYKRFRDQGRSVTDLFVNTDTSNARVDTYNRLIQDDRLRRGEIGGRHLEYRSTSAGRHETLYEGDRVALVKGVEDRGTRIANGRKGTIVRIDEQHRRAIVRLDDGKAVRVDVAISDPMVPLRLAYAGHATRTQGSEAPVVLVVPGSANTTLESAYSSLSRGQEEIHVFADTTTHGPDPLEDLAQRWARPEPKRTASARAADSRAGATMSSPVADVPPAGGGPMTGRQAHYLASLAARAGEEAEGTLTRLEATERITELQQRIGRSPPPWARSLATELAALRAVSAKPEETAQSAATRLAEAREDLRTGTDGPGPVSARLAEGRSRLRERSDVNEALDVSATEAIEALAAEGRLAAEDALHPKPVSFEPPPIDFSPERRESEAERGAEAGRELSRQRSRERGRHRPPPGVGMGH